MVLVFISNQDASTPALLEIHRNVPIGNGNVSRRSKSELTNAILEPDAFYIYYDTIMSTLARLSKINCDWIDH